MNSEIGYWLDALNGIGKSPDLHFGVLVKNTQPAIDALENFLGRLPALANFVTGALAARSSYCL